METVFLHPGIVKKITGYADNQPYGHELRICLSVDDWCEFINQKFYDSLIEWLHTKGIQGSVELRKARGDEHDRKQIVNQRGSSSDERQ